MTTQFLEKDFRCFNTDELFVLQNFHLRKKKNGAASKKRFWGYERL